MQDRSTVVVETLKYPESGKLLPQFWEEIPDVGDSFSLTRVATVSGGTGDQPETTDPARAGELERSFEAGREQGTRQGRELERQEHETQLLELEKKHVAQAAELVNQLAHERGRFLEAVEQDVVRLALAIAERVLRREAQMDPLFLVGAVRVALGQLAENMQVRLRIPAPEAELWTETMAHLPGLKIRPEIVPDPGIELGDCVLESEMGSADLGLAAQMDSIRLALLDDASTADRRDAADRDLRAREAHP